MKLAVSACLLGYPCRYDGSICADRSACALLERDDLEIVAICPEQEGGLPTPRPACEIVHSGAYWQIKDKDGTDYSEAFVRGAERTLEIVSAEGCRAAILKSKSPSCASREVYDGTFSATLRYGSGVAAKLLLEAGIFVIDESEITQHFGSATAVPCATFTKAWKHLKTINAHKMQVMRLLFRVGLYKQALLHDLSKYSPGEFYAGMRYFCGTRSPNGLERDMFGYSRAWLHHKGRNRHHYEYWTDIRGRGDGRIIGAPMPTRYVVEMFCDRVAACKVYQGDTYRNDSALRYYENWKHTYALHPYTAELLEYMLHLLAQRGEEEALRIIRKDIVESRHTAGPAVCF